MTVIGNAWDQVLAGEFAAEYYRKLWEFLDQAYASRTVYPPKELVFEAFRLTPPDRVRVVILGQDPYIREGQAHGVALSVPPGVALPPSLKNIFKELTSDCGHPAPSSGDLTKWARQGVLLLNTVLTVEAGKSGSHANLGWERFTDAVIRYLNSRPEPVAFLLWGKPAQRKQKLITNPWHGVFVAPHPSPLSAHTGFFGSRPFSSANAFLVARGYDPIDWRLA